jgi:hypothetical protein
VSSFAATVGGARRNASQTVHSKGTDTDGTDGPAGGREGWWDGAKAESIPLPSYHDGIMIVRQKKAQRLSASVRSSLPFHSRPFTSSGAKETTSAPKARSSESLFRRRIRPYPGINIKRQRKRWKSERSFAPILLTETRLERHLLRPAAL